MSTVPITPLQIGKCSPETTGSVHDEGKLFVAFPSCMMDSLPINGEIDEEKVFWTLILEEDQARALAYAIQHELLQLHIERERELCH